MPLGQISDLTSERDAGVGYRVVLVQCSDCGDSEELTLLESVIEYPASKWLRNRGWSVSPLRCPQCLARERDEAEALRASRENQ